MKIDTQIEHEKVTQVEHFFSKELLKLENGAVKKVRVEPNAFYPEHLHPDKTEYVYVLQGHPHFQIGVHVYAARPDEFYIFPTNTKHSIRNYSQKDCVLLVGSIKNSNTEV